MAAKTIGLFLIISFVSIRSTAQIRWQQTNGPEGGAVSAVCVDSIGHIFICTKAGGIFESGDKGDHWVSHNEGLPTLYFHNLEAGSRGYAYALSNSYGIFRMKRDDNSKWVALDTTSNFNISDMAVDALGDLFISTSSYGILVSHDNGDHFTATNSGIDSLDISKASFIKFLAISTDGRMYALSSRRVPYTSSDRGQHWTALAKNDSSGDPITFYSLPNGSLLTGDLKGKSFLLTGGGSWQQILKVDTSYIYNFFYSPKTGHTFARYSNGLLFRSTDMGLNWVTVSGEIEGAEYFPSAVDTAGVIFSGIDNDGMMRSFDDGEHFETINNGLIGIFIVKMQVDAQNNVYCNSGQRIYRTSDKGQHWQRLPVGIHGVLMAPVYSIDSAGAIYANDNGWVDVSNDHGETWSKTLQSFRPQNLRITYALASTKEQTFAATNQGLYSTRDHGQTWKSVTVVQGTSDSSLQFITFVIGSDGALYTQSPTGALYKSSNGGVSWGDPVGRSGQLQIVMKDGMTMFRFNNERVDRSTDGGQNWTGLSVDTAREAANSFQLFEVSIDDKNQLFACTDSGIYISKDLGDTWLPSSEGLRGPSQVPISGATSVCQDRLGNYFAASHGQGVFINVDPTRGVKHERSANGPSVQFFPNPVANEANLQFTLTSGAAISAEMTDVLGRIVWSSSDKSYGAGTYIIRVSVKDIPNGSYLCSVKHGDTHEDAWLQVAH